MEKHDVNVEKTPGMGLQRLPCSTISHPNWGTDGALVPTMLLVPGNQIGESGVVSPKEHQN